VVKALRALLAIALVTLLAGCGYVGDPRPPSLQIPPAPTALSARQIGDRLIGEFTVGTMTLDVAPLRLAGGVVRIGSREVPIEAMPGGTSRFTVPSAEWTGQTVTVAARLRGAPGRWSAWSNQITLKVEPPVAVPRAFTARLAAKGVELRWEPTSAASIERRLMGDAAFAPLRTADAPPFIDDSVELAKTYEYRIQAKVGDALSEPSATASITFQDRFPPPVPTGLDAVAGLDSIELSWDSIDDPDFYAYIVYRAGPGAENTEFTALGEPTMLPSLSDRTLRRDVTYRYAVASIDRAGNISARSKPVEIVLPAR
jgi:hypothetical protein